MNSQLVLAFDDCLTALSAGGDMEALLARFPQYVDELRPLLLAALAAHSLGATARVPRQVQMQSRRHFLARASELRE